MDGKYDGRCAYLYMVLVGNCSSRVAQRAAHVTVRTEAAAYMRRKYRRWWIIMIKAEREIRLSAK
eukprot:2933501-Pleurochrysis_carterae.AAC.1